MYLSFATIVHLAFFFNPLLIGLKKVNNKWTQTFNQVLLSLVKSNLAYKLQWNPQSKLRQQQDLISTESQPS